jgi:hypothetical protein
MSLKHAEWLSGTAAHGGQRVVAEQDCAAVLAGLRLLPPKDFLCLAHTLGLSQTERLLAVLPSRARAFSNFFLGFFN